jgi:carbamate kinase
VLLTDVACVEWGFGTPESRPIRRASPAELRAQPFPDGSMGPKVEAACRFVEATGNRAVIGRLEDAVALLDGSRGTVVTPAGSGTPGPVRGAPAHASGGGPDRTQ